MGQRSRDHSQALIDELTQLTHDLQRVRQESLAASRKGDFRAVARLTCEAARLNRMILAAEGAEVPVRITLDEKLFTGESDENDALTAVEADVAFAG
jgi:hypothetical protein